MEIPCFPFPGHVLRMVPMTSTEAIELLARVSQREIAGTEKSHARDLVTVIDCLPLAIVSAAKFIKNTIEEYFDGFSVHDLLLASNPLTGRQHLYKRSLRTIWSLEISKLKKSSS
jgi:hypothetical protein